jgi:hypothetical protein
MVLLMTPITLNDWLPGLLPILIYFLIWLIPVLVAFASLRNHPLDETAKAVWVLIILILPIIGPITYLALHRSGQNTSK